LATFRYGDVYPLTDAGKLLAVAYMPLSIAVFSGLLAAFAKATFRALIAATCDADGRGLVQGGRAARRARRGERLVRSAAQVTPPLPLGGACKRQEGMVRLGAVFVILAPLSFFQTNNFLLSNKQTKTYGRVGVTLGAALDLRAL
jgi:hypothetical protein